MATLKMHEKKLIQMILTGALQKLGVSLTDDRITFTEDDSVVYSDDGIEVVVDDELEVDIELELDEEEVEALALGNDINVPFVIAIGFLALVAGFVVARVAKKID